MSTIALLTDFGTRDWFVGSMKGVIADINPNVHVIDITHDIKSGDIRSAALTLLACFNSFPAQTIFVTVVDPGVGGKRKPVAIQTHRHVFLGPDNGVLSLAIKNEKIISRYTLENSLYFRLPVSKTFHGRDIFAPVAAHISRGVTLNFLGPEQKTMVTLPWVEPVFSRNKLRGTIIHIDKFGNCISSIDHTLFKKISHKSLTLSINGKRMPVKEFYQAVTPGKPVGLLDSSGFLEVAVNGGNAAEQLKISIGDKVLVS